MNVPRSSGILLHITSLPSPYGIGDLGPGAYRFADFLSYTKQHIWQVLPLVPVGLGYSPYSSPSTFAGNPLLISPERLHEQGLLADDDLADRPPFSAHEVQFDVVESYKHHLLERAFERFERGEGSISAAAFENFCERNAEWLDDYALFMVLKKRHDGRMWTDWPEPLALRHEEALAEARVRHARALRMRRLWQFLFAQQWADLKVYCNERGIRIFGDLPIYVAADSADVWAHPSLFQLDERRRPTAVAGVPPDYFSETGQRWGNPLYRWDVMHENGYRWWTRRMTAMLKQVDLVRLDHFRGFEAYWSVPAHEETAVNGRWVQGPGADLFEALQRELGAPLPIVAEDLGLITAGVKDLMRQFAFPGMAVIQFAFDEEPDHPFLPHNFRRNLIAYTGTHDNNTITGWWQGNGDSASPRARAFARRYLDLDEAREQEVHWTFIRLLMSSVADVVVFPMQDLLGLGSHTRMNIPGKASDNWAWRLTSGQLTQAVADRFETLTTIYGRAAPEGTRHVETPHFEAVLREA